MALIRSFDSEVRVDDGQFFLLDSSTTDLPQPPITPTQWLHAGPGWIHFRSGAQDHYASVRFELWQDLPPRTTEPWELVDTVEVVSSSGIVQLWAPTIGPPDGRWELGHPGRYGLRAQCRGRQAAAQALNTAVTTDNPLPRGVEQYRLQFWSLEPPS